MRKEEEFSPIDLMIILCLIGIIVLPVYTVFFASRNEKQDTKIERIEKIKHQLDLNSQEIEKLKAEMELLKQK